VKTIEFIAQNQDGFIKIPAKYSKTLTAKFKVLITIEPTVKTKSPKVAGKKMPIISRNKREQAIIEKILKKHDAALKELATK
jgi:hypothetical protein